MKTSTLFVVGLIVGSVAVFGLRATAATDGADPAAETTPPAPADPHAGHDMTEPSSGPAPAPAPAPASAPAPAPGASDPHAGHDMRVPENEICPVMGNEVDPEVFVDYQGRRIGFCCAGCDEQFLKDPEKYLKKVDAELAARGKAK